MDRPWHWIWICTGCVPMFSSPHVPHDSPFVHQSQCFPPGFPVLMFPDPLFPSPYIYPLSAPRTPPPPPPPPHPHPHPHPLYIFPCPHPPTPPLSGEIFISTGYGGPDANTDPIYPPLYIPLSAPTHTPVIWRDLYQHRLRGVQMPTLTEESSHFLWVSGGLPGNVPYFKEIWLNHPVLAKLAYQSRPRRAAHPCMVIPTFGNCCLSAIGGGKQRSCLTGWVQLSAEAAPGAIFTNSLDLRLDSRLGLDPDRVSSETRSGSKSSPIHKGKSSRLDWVATKVMT